MKKIHAIAAPLVLIRYALLIVLVIFAFSSLIYLLWSALCPFTTDLVEGSIMLYGSMFSRGEPIYRDLSSRPYAVNAYNPLHTIIVGALIRLFGVSPVPAKIFSFIVTLLIALLIFMIIKRTSGKSFWALFFSLLFLTEPETLNWGSTARNDMLVIAFALAALYSFHCRSRYGILIAGFLIICAFFTKQSTIAAFAALLFHIYREGGIKKALSFFLPIMAVILAIMTALNFSTKGHYLFSVLFYHFITMTDPASAKILIGSFLLNHFPLLLLSIISFICILGCKDLPDRNMVVLQAAYLGALILQSPSVFKNGASHNLFLELNASTCIMSGILFSFLFPSLDLPKSAEPEKRVMKLSPVLLCALISLLLVIQIFFLWGPRYLYNLPGISFRSIAQRSFPGRFKKIIEEDTQVIEEIKNYPDPIWSESVSLLLLAHREIIVGEPFSYTFLPARLYDFETLLSYFRDRKLSMVILGDRNMPDISYLIPGPAFNELQKNYVLKKRIGPYHLFVPSATSPKSHGKDESH